VYFYRGGKYLNKLNLIDRILNRKKYVRMCGLINDKIAFKNVIQSTIFLKYRKKRPTFMGIVVNIKMLGFYKHN